MTVEIVAYKGKDDKGQFGEIETFEGTPDQISELRKQLLNNWLEIAGVEIEIVYSGTDPEEASKSIIGLPRISDVGKLSS